MCVNMHMCMYVDMQAHVYVYVHMCIHFYVDTCSYACIYVYGMVKILCVFVCVCVTEWEETEKQNDFLKSRTL